MSVLGYSIKNVKLFKGMEGYGMSCSLYKNGKKVADYTDDGNGGRGSIWFGNKEEEKAFNKAMWSGTCAIDAASKAYGQKFHDDSMPRLVEIIRRNMHDEEYKKSEEDRMTNYFPYLGTAGKELDPVKLAYFDTDIFMQILENDNRITRFYNRTKKNAEEHKLYIDADGNGYWVKKAPSEGGYIVTSQKDLEF